MRAVVAHLLGEPDSFVIEEVPCAAPATGEVRVAIRTAAVNFVDCLVASGRYQVCPPLPFIPGGEFAGIVEAVGPGVTDFAEGDRVSGSGLGGAFAEAVTVRATAIALLPQGMDFIDAATFRVANATAMAALVQGAQLRSGETVLVLGAGGGVGLAATGIARALGARVIAAASTEAKRALATRAGAESTVASDASDWRDQVRTLAPQGIDVVVDPVGGAVTERAFRTLAWGGRHLVIGFADGAIPSLPTNLALVKGLKLIGVNIREFHLRHPSESASNMERLAAMWRDGLIHAAPATVLPMSRFAEAMSLATQRSHIGRVVLDVAAEAERPVQKEHRQEK